MGIDIEGTVTSGHREKQSSSVIQIDFHADTYQNHCSNYQAAEFLD